MRALLLAVAVLLVAMLVSLAGCGEASIGYDYVAEPEAGEPEARQGHDPYVAEPRRVPKPKTCSDYANAHEILIDEQAGKLTKSDKQWLDMDGDGRYCEERGVVWQGERTQAE
jgi:hypothetical protein